jgi:hypothetical protein
MNSNIKTFTLLLFALVTIPYLSYTQKEAVGITLNTVDAFEGYVLTYDEISTLYLLDNCGEKVHEWKNIDRPRLHFKLLPNGNIIYVTYDNSIMIKDWNNNIVKEIINPLSGVELVYEVIVMPNGNYLTLARKEYSFSEFEALGFIGNIGAKYGVIDCIIEFDGNNGSVVWEWYLADHIIQDRTSNSPNYGNIYDNPQLMDLGAILTYDWNNGESFMINGFDYNPTSDEIAISVRKLSEVMIIDHSTTTAEAAGHTGGFHNKGGDVLYRWGNPQNYGREGDRELFFQHNPNWIDYGIHKGKIIIFNNGLGRTTGFTDRYSSVDIIDPPKDQDGKYILEVGKGYGPESPNWRYTDNEGDQNFFSGYTSGAKVLPNGNIYITEGYHGRLFEVNLQKEKLWEYGMTTVSYLYRSEKYGLDYAAFTGRDLTAKGPIDESSYDCTLYSSIENTFEKEEYSVKYDFGNGVIYISSYNDMPSEIKIYTIMGQQIMSNFFIKDLTINTSNFSSGIYILNITNNEKKILTKKIFIQ